MTNQDFQDRVRSCERRLYSMAYMLLHRTADCEDAVQEAVLRAWQRLPSLRNEQFFETWLIRIVINECKNQLTKSKRRGETELSTQFAEPESPEPELYEALASLEWKHRIVITLKYIDGYTLDEMSRILVLPKGTVASRLDRAKRLLREQLKGEAKV